MKGVLLMNRRQKFSLNDKHVCYCKFCNFPISNPAIYPGKKLMITRYCPSCHTVNSFALLSTQDQKFLRAGFFSNPLYPISPQTLQGVPLKFSLIFYPASVFLNFLVNILYMPFGLVYNNYQIKKSNKAFFDSYSNQDTNVIFLDMLKKRADNGLSYAAFKMGQLHITGTGVEQDLDLAEHYFVIAKNDYESGIISLVKALLITEEPDYEKAFRILNLIKDNPQATYYLAYLYYNGFGVKQNNRIANVYASTARDAKIKDFYGIYSKLSM